MKSIIRNACLTRFDYFLVWVLALTFTTSCNADSETIPSSTKFPKLHHSLRLHSEVRQNFRKSASKSKPRSTKAPYHCLGSSACLDSQKQQIKEQTGYICVIIRFSHRYRSLFFILTPWHYCSLHGSIKSVRGLLYNELYFCEVSWPSLLLWSIKAFNSHRSICTKSDQIPNLTRTLTQKIFLLASSVGSAEAWEHHKHCSIEANHSHHALRCRSSAVQTNNNGKAVAISC